MNKLFDLAEQEKIPGIIILHHGHPNGSARGRVFEYYAKKHNFSDEQIRDITISTPADLKHNLLPLLPEISGKLLITCSSLINYDLIQLCIDNGLICGRDYQLVCYDNLKEKNIQLPSGIPEITSIDYSRTAAAQTAAKLLIHSVQNPHVIGCQTIKFPTSLRIKESAFANRKDLITL
jgi:DNA-binding LacI/PurR family transcriptional regulator